MSEERLARLLASQEPFVLLSDGGRYGVLLRRDGAWVYFTANTLDQKEQVAETGVKFADLMTIERPHQMAAFWDCLTQALSESRRLGKTTYFLFSRDE